MNVSHFRQLLQAAAAEPQPQRLLFVFARAELPPDAPADQRQRFHDGRGGALTTLMCVDKAPGDLGGFDELAAEARAAGPPWQVMFAACLSGHEGHAPHETQVEAGLRAMVSAIESGAVGRFAAYDAAGDPIRFV